MYVNRETKKLLGISDFEEEITHNPQFDTKKFKPLDHSDDSFLSLKDILY